MIFQKRQVNLTQLLAGLSTLLCTVACFAEGPQRNWSARFRPAAETIRAQVTSPFASPPAEKTGFTESIKGGFDKMTGAFSSKKEKNAPREVKDELSLSNRAEPSPKLHTSLARVFESQGKLKEAEVEFRKALEVDPKSRLALLEYARFLDRQEQFDAAVGLYRHAEKLHRNDAAVQNDLGLCFARHNRNTEAIAAFKKAVEIAPKNVLYRNNIALVLVDLGRYDEAMENLIAVNGRAVAEYNMGYLLYKKGNITLAAKHFKAAASYNPHMKQAQWWIARAEQEQPSPPNRRQIARPSTEPTLQPPASIARRPEYTAMHRRPQTVPAPMVWAQSTESKPTFVQPQTPTIERIPPLRQPQTIVPSPNVRRQNQPTSRPVKLPSISSPQPGNIEQFPPVRQ